MAYMQHRKSTELGTQKLYHETYFSKTVGRIIEDNVFFFFFKLDLWLNCISSSKKTLQQV